MVSLTGRVVAVALAAVVVVLALGTALRSAPATAAASCAAPCESVAAVPAETPCVSDPACAGHTSPAPSSVAVDAAPVVVVAGAMLLATVARRRTRAALPRLLAPGGLYRPPRLSA